MQTRHRALTPLSARPPSATLSIPPQAIDWRSVTPLTEAAVCSAHSFAALTRPSGRPHASRRPRGHKSTEATGKKDFDRGQRRVRGWMVVFSGKARITNSRFSSSSSSTSSSGISRSNSRRRFHQSPLPLCLLTILVEAEQENAFSVRLLFNESLVVVIYCRLPDRYICCHGYRNRQINTECMCMSGFGITPGRDRCSYYRLHLSPQYH